MMFLKMVAVRFKNNKKGRNAIYETNSGILFKKSGKYSYRYSLY